MQRTSKVKISEYFDSGKSQTFQRRSDIHLKVELPWYSCISSSVWRQFASISAGQGRVNGRTWRYHTMCDWNYHPSPFASHLANTQVSCFKECELQLTKSFNRDLKNAIQEVTITGFDTHKFKVAMEGIAALQNVFNKHIHPTRMLDWTPRIVNSWSLRVGSWYFTTGLVSADEVIIPFPSSVDPEGILGLLDKQRFRHTIENDVGYFKREVKGDQKFKYVLSLSLNSRLNVSLTF